MTTMNPILYIWPLFATNDHGTVVVVYTHIASFFSLLAAHRLFCPRSLSHSLSGLSSLHSVAVPWPIHHFPFDPGSLSPCLVNFGKWLWWPPTHPHESPPGEREGPPGDSSGKTEAIRSFRTESRQTTTATTTNEAARTAATTSSPTPAPGGSCCDGQT